MLKADCANYAIIHIYVVNISLDEGITDAILNFVAEKRNLEKTLPSCFTLCFLKLLRFVLQGLAIDGKEIPLFPRMG
jgi:hypothetical protein